MSIVVHGPQGCGKTRNAETLRKYFGMKRVVEMGETEDLDVYRRWGDAFFKTGNTLYLTNEAPPPHLADERRIVAFDVAIQRARGAQ